MMNTMIRYASNFYVRLFDNNVQTLECLVADGDAKSIVQFLERDVDAHAHARTHAYAPTYYDTVLIWSARNGHIEIVNMLLERGIRITSNNSSALNCSAKNNHLEIVLALLKIDTERYCLGYALMLAAKEGHVDIVTTLLEHGANVRAGDNESLYVSIRGNHLAVVTVLLEWGAEAPDHYSMGMCQNRFLSCAFRHSEIMAKLLEHGVDVHAGYRTILRKLQRQFCESIADVILPYCSAEDYQYFPDCYIKGKIIPTKNPNMRAIISTNE